MACAYWSASSGDINCQAMKLDLTTKAEMNVLRAAKMIGVDSSSPAAEGLDIARCLHSSTALILFP